MGFVEEIKSIFNEKMITGMGYAVASGLLSGALGAILERYSNGSKWAAWLGYIVGAGGMAYIADEFFKHPEWKIYAAFGGLFPPLWELVTDKISPEDIASKVSAGLGMTWQTAATQYYAPAQPVSLTVEAAPVETAPTAPVEEEFLY